MSLPRLPLHLAGNSTTAAISFMGGQNFSETLLHGSLPVFPSAVLPLALWVSLVSSLESAWDVGLCAGDGLRRFSQGRLGKECGKQDRTGEGAKVQLQAKPSKGSCSLGLQTSSVGHFLCPSCSKSGKGAASQWLRPG